MRIYQHHHHQQQLIYILLLYDSKENVNKGPYSQVEEQQVVVYMSFLCLLLSIVSNNQKSYVNQNNRTKPTCHRVNSR